MTTTNTNGNLLDQIHAARATAIANNQHALAEWITKHADEPCPAAIAEFVGMGRRCVATTNVYGLALRHPSVGCSGDEYHIDFDPTRHLCVMSARTLCPHHAPVYAAERMGDGEQSDAAKEAIALAEEHADHNDSTHFTSKDASIRCWTVRRFAPIVAALADATKRAEDAERQLGDILYCAYKFDDKPHQLFNAIRRVANERPDHDAAEIERLMSEEYERPPRALLTRQLETARRVGDGALIVFDSLTQDGGSERGMWLYEQLGGPMEEMRSALAAIDAPAPDRAPTPKSCEHCGCDLLPRRKEPILCESCVAVCSDDCDHRWIAPERNDNRDGGSDGHGGGIITSDAKRLAARRPADDAPELEQPKICNVRVCTDAYCENSAIGCACDSRCGELVPCEVHSPAPPSSVPNGQAGGEAFSAEEARNGARAHATEAARLRSGDDGTEYTERFAAEHSRTAATLRKYADMLERERNWRQYAQNVATCRTTGCSHGIAALLTPETEGK